MPIRHAIWNVEAQPTLFSVAELTAARNLFAAALVDAVWLAHMTPSGQMEEISAKDSTWSISTNRLYE